MLGSFWLIPCFSTTVCFIATFPLWKKRSW